MMDSPYRPLPPKHPRDVSDAEIRSVADDVRAGQRFVPAATLGLLVAVVGTVMVVVVLDWLGWTDWIVLSWSCVAVVAAISLCIRIWGRGVQPHFALLGAAVGLLVPLVAELCAIILAKRHSAPAFLGLSRLEIAAFIHTRGGWDWVLFLITALGGAKLAGKSVTFEDIRRRLQLRPPSERKDVVESFTKWNSDL